MADADAIQPPPRRVSFSPLNIDKLPPGKRVTLSLFLFFFFFSSSIYICFSSFIRIALFFSEEENVRLVALFCLSVRCLSPDGIRPRHCNAAAAYFLYALGPILAQLIFSILQQRWGCAREFWWNKWLDITFIQFVVVGQPRRASRTFIDHTWLSYLGCCCCCCCLLPSLLLLSTLNLRLLTYLVL